MLLVPSVRSAGSNLKFLSGSPFDTLIGVSDSSGDANSKGNFYKSGNDKILTESAFQNEKFPYWYFLRTASKN